MTTVRLPNKSFCQLLNNSSFPGPSHGWSSWTDFGPCDTLCQHTRQRFCASRDLKNCPNADGRGIQTETKDCGKEKCYGKYFVDGNIIKVLKLFYKNSNGTSQFGNQEEIQQNAPFNKERFFSIKFDIFAHS